MHVYCSKYLFAYGLNFGQYIKKVSFTPPPTSMRRFRRHTRNTLRGVNKNRIYGKTRQNSLKDTAIRIKKEKRAKAPASVGGYAKCRRVYVQFCLFSAKKYKKNRKREQLLLIIIYFVLFCIILVIIIRIYIPIHMNLFSYEWVYKSYCIITAKNTPTPSPATQKSVITYS